MTHSPENRTNFISQQFEEIKGKTSRDPIKVRVPGEFVPPKSLVLREDSTFLDTKDKGVIQGVIDGKSNRQIAQRRDTSHGSVKSRLAKVGRQLRSEGFEIPNGNNRVNIILALIENGDLELRSSGY